MAGYSPNPLWKKLGYKPGLMAFLHGQPAGYLTWLDLPQGMEINWLDRTEPDLGFAHIFFLRAAELKKSLASLRNQLAQDGVVWVSWPKKSSGVITDITEDTIRQLALPLGFVDIKVCAVDAVWSGLKLMIRKTERRKSPASPA